MSPLSLHIAIFDCDTPVPNVYAERGLYSDIFAALLNDAAKQTPGLPDLKLSFSKYDCVLGEVPSEEDLLQIDAIIITGSASSAYDPAPWVISLTKLTREIYTHHRRIKIFGSCFGHQVLCHALFSTSTRTAVERDPRGWELGVHPINLTPSFLSHYGPVLSNSSSASQLRLQFVHADHVVLPSLPEGFEGIGSSEHCVLQGVWEQGRVLTYQGHAEFDRFVNGETIKVFGKAIWSEDFMEKTLEMVDRDDDSRWAAGVMLRFFLENEKDMEEQSSSELVGNVGEEVMARL